MSDDPPGVEPEIGEDTIEHTLARVEELAPTPVCPCCGATEWNGSSVVDGLMMVAVEIEGPEADGEDDGLGGQTLQRISGVAFACAKCGFLRFHVSPSADLRSAPEP